MIRKFKESDINLIMEIWIDTNIKAHSFISEQYWKDNFEFVKEMILQSEIYVYEQDNRIQGFVGLKNNYIAGIFVTTAVQSKGIGKQLLDYVKKLKTELTLSVYRKNLRAIEFYRRENFYITAESKDENTNETEYTMIWNKANVI